MKLEYSIIFEYDYSYWIFNRSKYNKYIANKSHKKDPDLIILNNIRSIDEKSYILKGSRKEIDGKYSHWRNVKVWSKKIFCRTHFISVFTYWLPINERIKKSNCVANILQTVLKVNIINEQIFEIFVLILNYVS